MPTLEGCPRWPGLCQDFHRMVVELGASPEGCDLRRRAEARFMYAENKPFLLGPPQMIRAELRDHLCALTQSYQRCIERIVAASREDGRVLDALSSPDDLAADLEADTDPANGRVHIFRLDILLDADGGFKILETNANCPGGFVFSGICNRAWREFLEEHDYPTPPALRHEAPGFHAEWFLDAIRAETGVSPSFLPLIREEGGNRLELGDFTRHIRERDIACEEIDPRQIRYRPATGGVTAEDGRAFEHAYLKLGMQRFLALREGLDDFVHAVRDRALFVQNGQRGRWVGDDKLCLAILSDPDFADLFDPTDLAVLEDHIPWSRNAARLDPDRLESVRREPARYVLKRGLDTRGYGVVVGRESTDGQWTDAVDRAVEERWLVQEFQPTTWIEGDFDSPELQRHDIAAGAINGELTTLFMRSSGEMRVNMSRTGRMHPLFLGG